MFPRGCEDTAASSRLTPPPCISYANVHNYYGPYAYCSLDKGVACAQHIQLLTHPRAGGEETAGICVLCGLGGVRAVTSAAPLEAHGSVMRVLRVLHV